MHIKEKVSLICKTTIPNIFEYELDMPITIKKILIYLFYYIKRNLLTVIIFNRNAK